MQLSINQYNCRLLCFPFHRSFLRFLHLHTNFHSYDIREIFTLFQSILLWRQRLGLSTISLRYLNRFGSFFNRKRLKMDSIISVSVHSLYCDDTTRWWASSSQRILMIPFRYNEDGECLHDGSGRRDVSMGKHVFPFPLHVSHSSKTILSDVNSMSS